MIIIALIGFAFVLVQAVQAATTEPGSEADPIVSKSYVDEQLQWKVEELSNDQILECQAGAEIILRGGSASAIASQQGGLSDVTGGRDLQTGAIIPTNHLLIIPRSDGRGIQATSEKIWVMVKGAYEIK